MSVKILQFIADSSFEINEIKNQIDNSVKILGLEYLYEKVSSITDAIGKKITIDMLSSARELLESIKRAKQYLAQTDISKFNACVSIGIDATVSFLLLLRQLISSVEVSNV